MESVADPVMWILFHSRLLTYGLQAQTLDGFINNWWWWIKEKNLSITWKDELMTQKYCSSLNLNISLWFPHHWSTLLSTPTGEHVHVEDIAVPGSFGQRRVLCWHRSGSHGGRQSPDPDPAWLCKHPQTVCPQDVCRGGAVGVSNRHPPL